MDNSINSFLCLFLSFNMLFKVFFHEKDIKLLFFGVFYMMMLKIKNSKKNNLIEKYFKKHILYYITKHTPGICFLKLFFV